MSEETNEELERFVGKIDYEGGIYGALEYGLTQSGYELPKEVADQWTEIVDAFGEVESMVAEFWELCEKYGVDY